MLEPIFNNFETFLFVFIRVMSIFMMIPFIGGRSVPVQIRVAIALLLGLVITPTLPIEAPMPESILAITFAIGKELVVGIMIGLTAKLVFSSFEMAGQLAGMQMGYSMANVLDPQTSSQLSVMAQFYNIFAIFLFFTLDIHLIFISGLIESFKIIPPYGATLTGPLFNGVLSISTELFIVALKLAAPVSIAVLLANLGMGIVARTVPQLNVFVVGFPITIGVGLIVFFFSISFISSTIGKVYIDLSNNLFDLVRLSAG
jgi:flagellar biosynthetic protein FliR